MFFSDLYHSLYETLECEKPKGLRNRKCNKLKYYRVIITTGRLLHCKIGKVFFVIKPQKMNGSRSFSQFVYVHICMSLR